MTQHRTCMTYFFHFPLLFDLLSLLENKQVKVTFRSKNKIEELVLLKTIEVH